MLFSITPIQGISLLEKEIAKDLVTVRETAYLCQQVIWRPMQNIK